MLQDICQKSGLKRFHTIKVVYTAVAHGLCYLCNLCSIDIYAHMYSFMQEAANVIWRSLSFCMLRLLWQLVGRSRSLNVSLVCEDFWRLSGSAPAGPLVSYSVTAILGRLSQVSMFASAAFLGCRLCRGTVAVLSVALWAAVFALLDCIMTRHRHVTRPRARGRPCKLSSQLNRKTEAQEILPNPKKTGTCLA